MLVKDLYILKKPYVAPLVEFEELEQDDMEMLMISQTDGETPNPGAGTINDPNLPPPPAPSSLDLDFSLDFVVNEEPME